MSLHTQEWLGAYLDGELSPAQIRKTEAHLANCPECQRKLDELRSLSALLGEAPVATGLKSEEQFVAEVGLQLKRKAITSAQTFPMTRSRENTPQSPALHWSWLVIPLVLLLAWSFVQTVSVVSDMLIAISEKCTGFTPFCQPLSPEGYRLSKVWSRAGWVGNSARMGLAGEPVSNGNYWLTIRKLDGRLVDTQPHL
jgi:predicted anti-sigma-YlaC factor YlaD